MGAHRLGITLATQLPAAVLEVADQLLFLGIDRDGRLAGGDGRLHRGIDVLKLGIAVGMVGPFPRLAIGLTAILLLAQQLADQPLAHLEALSAQRLGDVALAPADPAQRGFRITADRILDHRLESGQQAGLALNLAFAAGTGSTDAPADLVASGPQLDHAAVDRASRNPCRRGNCHHAATPQRHRLIRCIQSAPELVQKRF
jgi:hypothetical protein